MDRIEKYLITNKTPKDKLYSHDAVSKHDQLNDCYIAIRGKVYDMTKYKNYLKKNNKNRNLDMLCGSVYNINPISIFKTDHATKFEIGNIKYYTLLIYLKIFTIIITQIFCLIKIFKNKMNSLLYLIFVINSYIIIRWLIKLYTYKTPINFRSSYV